MKIVRRILTSAVAMYVLLVMGMFAFQRSLLYFPSREYVTLADAHANEALRELPVKTADGIDLKGWYAPATSKAFTFVFFHGNGDSLAGDVDVPEPCIAAGYGFLIAEYRGYSGLPGKPTEQGLYADGRAYLYGLMAQGVKSENIMLMGHSLGTGVAVQLAGEFKVGGLILLAPYLSMTKMAQIHYPFIPAKLLVLDRFENEKKIAGVRAPVLIVNGAEDNIVPPSQGKRLYELANEPKRFDSLQGRGHNDILEVFAPMGIEWAGRLPTVPAKFDSGGE